MGTDNLNNYLLRYASFGGEPLYILLSDSIDGNLANSYQEVIECIFKLYTNGFLKCRWHPMDVGKFNDIYNLTLGQLNDYIISNVKNGFSDYPEEGGEYFFETTEEGEKKIPEDYYMPGWFD